MPQAEAGEPCVWRRAELEQLWCRLCGPKGCFCWAGSSVYTAWIMAWRLLAEHVLHRLARELAASCPVACDDLLHHRMLASTVFTEVSRLSRAGAMRSAESCRQQIDRTHCRAPGQLQGSAGVEPGPVKRAGSMARAGCQWQTASGRHRAAGWCGFLAWLFSCICLMCSACHTVSIGTASQHRRLHMAPCRGLIAGH